MFWRGWFRLAAFVWGMIRKRLSSIFRTLNNRQGRVTANTLTQRGGLYSSLGQHQQAIGFYKRALIIYREIGDRKLESYCLNNLSNAYKSLGQYSQEIEYHQRALTIYQELSDRKLESYCLNNLSITYKSLGQYPQEIEYRQRALTIYQELGDRSGIANTLSRLGIAYQSLKQHQQAIEHYQQALTLQRAIGNHQFEAYILVGLGYTYSRLEQYQQAIEYHQQALTIYQELSDRSGEGGSLCNLGNAYRYLGQYQQAIDHYQQALPILQAIGDRQFEANTLAGLGSTCSRLGQYQKSIEYNQQSLFIATEVGDRNLVAANLRDLGIAFRPLGQYQQAIKYLLQSLAICREMRNRNDEAYSLCEVSITYSHLGQEQKETEYLLQSLAIFREVRDRAGEASCLRNLGIVDNSVGQHQKAIDYLLQSLAIFQELDVKGGIANSLSSLGDAYSSLKQDQQAVEYYQQGLDMAREIGDRSLESGSLINLGISYWCLRQDQQAIEHYQQGLDIAVQIGYRQWEANALSNLGHVFSSLKQYQQAIEHYQQSIIVRESIQGELKIEEFKASFAAKQINTYKRLIALLWQESRFEEAFNYVERSRARAFLDQFANRPINIRTGVSTTLLQQEETLKAQITNLRTQLTQLLTQERSLQHQIAALRTQLVNLRSHPTHELDTEAIAALQKQLINLEKNYTNLLTELKLQSPETATLVSVDVASLEEIQGLLDADTTLIEYFLPEQQTLAFIITRNSFQTVTINVTQEDLTQKIEAFRRFASLNNPHPKSLQQLYEWLITPLKPLLNTSQLAIVPHGILHYLPFTALSTGECYLSDDYTIFTLPSASILRFLPQKRKPSTDTGIHERMPLLALGNPTTTEPLPPLHFAEQEVKTIAQLYDTQALIGAAATESIVFSQAGNAEIVHLAVHGEFSKHNPLFSTLYLAPDIQHDGRLEVHDIYALDLTKSTNLVVLSACQTQLGELSKGDEIVGLNRAFLYAGTPSVIATLWSVNDKVTGLLMQQFYNYLRSGLTKAQALRQAQMNIRAEYPHPYYWAAFVLTGDGSHVD